MREDVVTPATARLLQRAGLPWEPQLGDWCVILGGEVVAESQAGLWLVGALAPRAGLLGLMDAQSKWPMARVAAHDCLWLPSAGKLKVWLRAQGFRVATGEADPVTLGAGARHICKLTGAADTAPLGVRAPTRRRRLPTPCCDCWRHAATRCPTPTWIAGASCRTCPRAGSSHASRCAGALEGGRPERHVLHSQRCRTRDRRDCQPPSAAGVGVVR